MANQTVQITKKDELYELNEDLNSTNFERKKEAVKKVIANMTIGKDVSRLFQSVIKCLEFPEIEMKKLVYLYIINYSKTKPDDAIMVINLFRKDIGNKGNPLLRALAVRTMGCLRVHKLNEYLRDPLKSSLNDTEPYVRKTAALCIPKLFEVSPELVDEGGLIQELQNLLQKEQNPLVLANVILALSEIQLLQGKQLITVNQVVLQRLLTAINDCMEWGQVCIMDYLVNYIPNDQKEAEMIIERILPRLSHINPAVVFSAIKLVIKYLDQIKTDQIILQLQQKITPTLISLINNEKSEVKYCVLRCISHILIKLPGILEKDIKCFFCNVNEPYYIKNEKLDILGRICDVKNFEMVLNELALYLNEQDSNFVRKSIKQICGIAIRFSAACEKALQILLPVIVNIQSVKDSVDQYAQELIISMQKIYRKYPKQVTFKNGLNDVIKIIDLAQEELAKASACWLVGEFASEIPQCVELIKSRIEKFKDEEREVQLEILTSAVKIYVKYPNEGKNFIQQLLELAAYDTQNPDVRDRAFVYWRMLSVDPQKTKDSVLCQKPEIVEDEIRYDKEFLENMIDNLGMINTIYNQKEKEMFKIEQISRRQPIKLEKDDEEEKPAERTATEEGKKDEKNEKEKKIENLDQKTQGKITEPIKQVETNLLDIGMEDTKQAQTQVQPQQQQNIPPPKDNEKIEFNLLDIDISMTQNPQKPQTQTQDSTQQTKKIDNLNVLDLNLGDQNTSQSNYTFKEPQYQVILQEQTKGIENGKSGLRIEAKFTRENRSQAALKLKVINKSDVQMKELQIQFKPNLFQVKVQQQSMQILINQGCEKEIVAPLLYDAPTKNEPLSEPLTLILGFKTNIDLHYLSIPLQIYQIFNKCNFPKDYYKAAWQKIPQGNEKQFQIQQVSPEFLDPNNLIKLMETYNFTLVNSSKNNYQQDVIFMFSQTHNNMEVITQFIINPKNSPNASTQLIVICKSVQMELLQHIFNTVSQILSNNATIASNNMTTVIPNVILPPNNNNSNTFSLL